MREAPPVMASGASSRYLLASRLQGTMSTSSRDQSSSDEEEPAVEVEIERYVDVRLTGDALHTIVLLVVLLVVSSMGLLLLLPPDVSRFLLWLLLGG